MESRYSRVKDAENLPLSHVVAFNFAYPVIYCSNESIRNFWHNFIVLLNDFANYKSEPCLILQLVLTVMLTSVVVYIYTVIAFNFFRKFYVKEEDGSVDYKCHDMLTVCITACLLKGNQCYF